jgi:hypothetical protein
MTLLGYHYNFVMLSQQYAIIMLKIHRPISTLQAGGVLTAFTPSPLTTVDLNFLRFFILAVLPL